MQSFRLGSNRHGTFPGYPSLVREGRSIDVSSSPNIAHVGTRRTSRLARGLPGSMRASHWRVAISPWSKVLASSTKRSPVRKTRMSLRQGRITRSVVIVPSGSRYLTLAWPSVPIGSRFTVYCTGSGPSVGRFPEDRSLQLPAPIRATRARIDEGSQSLFALTIRSRNPRR